MSRGRGSRRRTKAKRTAEQPRVVRVPLPAPVDADPLDGMRLIVSTDYGPTED
jgi:hypothetical protein